MNEDDLIRREDALQMLREANGISDAADDIRALPAVAKGAAGGTCRNCGGSEWVCENHRDRPWPVACDCGGAGAPCPLCRWNDATAGVIGYALWPEELISEANKRLLSRVAQNRREKE